MHTRVLEAAGHSDVPEGARVKVRIGQGLKGPQVTELIEVDTSFSSSGEHDRAAHPSTPVLVSTARRRADRGMLRFGQMVQRR